MSILHRLARSPLAVSLAAAAVITMLCASPALTAIDLAAADALYQRPVPLDGEVVVVGIDGRAMEELGPYHTWSRDIMAQAIEALNQDPDSRPAAIGIDVVYAGQSDPETDAWLTEAAGAYGNVVVAANAEFGTGIVERDDGAFHLDPAAVLAFHRPYPELEQAAAVGHINAMFDSDGILRHAIWQVQDETGAAVPSFHRQLYRLYAQSHGLDPELTPPLLGQHWYLPFQAAPGSFYDGWSVSDLVYGDFDPAEFAGKVVLIGPYDAALQDSYPTAVDHAAPMFGVEIQANAVAALIRGDLRQELSPALLLLPTFLISAFLLFWTRQRSLLVSTAVWLGLCAGWLGLCLAANAFGMVVRPLVLPLAATGSYVLSIVGSYLHTAMEKRRITATFQRYVAPEIVSELLRSDSTSLDLGGQLTDIAVLFVDLRGFTTMCEGLPPPTVVEILNRYLTLTTDCIFRNGGTLDKFVGDCTMAFWGAPLPHHDPIFHAVKAALDMAEGSRSLSEELLQRYGRTVSFGVGVHFGPAVVGNIGSPTRMDYTAIGDTVNTAARLEANAPGGQILVSRAVADALEGRVRFTSLGDTIRLKGKSAGFEILQVDGLAQPDGKG